MPHDSPVEFIPDNYFVPLRPAALFPAAAPLEIDLGCGDGSFLAALAAHNPHRNFLGVERLLGRVRKTCRKIARAGLTNARVLRLESDYTVRYLLPAGSVTRCHLLFPDPWPKRRHEKRRLFQTAFLDALHAALAPAGELWIKTDNAPYFAAMAEVWRHHPGFHETAWPATDPYPITDFEREFLRADRPIHRARLVKD